MPDQDHIGTMKRSRNENWKQWQARLLAAQKLPKQLPPVPVPIDTPGLTISGKPYNEPQSEPPPEVPGREYIEGIFLGAGVANPRIIFIGIAGRHDRLAVFVRDPKNFVRGMLVRAYRDTTPGTTPAWYLNGPLPRSRGRY